MKHTPQDYISLIDVCFSCVYTYPDIDNEFHHNIVEVAVDPRGDSRVDLQTAVLNDNVMTKSIVYNRTDDKN